MGKGISILNLGLALMAQGLVAFPAGAQTLLIEPAGASSSEPVEQPVVSAPLSGGAGEVGKRQTADDAAPNLEPLGRIDNRVENRIQTRLRNRLDQNYGSQTDALSTFEAADSRARRQAKPR